MSARSSAAIFGDIFQHLAESPTDANKEFARWLWSKTAGYDFADYQLEADDALMALGLARRGVDPKHPDDGEMVVYGPPR